MQWCALAAAVSAEALTSLCQHSDRREDSRFSGGLPGCPQSGYLFEWIKFEYDVTPGLGHRASASPVHACASMPIRTTLAKTCYSLCMHAFFSADGVPCQWLSMDGNMYPKGPSAILEPQCPNFWLGSVLGACNDLKLTRSTERGRLEKPPADARHAVTKIQLHNINSIYRGRGIARSLNLPPA